MSGELVAEIGVPQEIKIELIHLQRNVGGVAVAHLDMPANEQRTVLQLGSTAKLQITTLADGSQIKASHEFVIECELAEMNVSIDGGRLRCPGCLKAEVGTAFEGETIGGNLVDMRKIEITSGHVETKPARRGSVGGAASEYRIVVEEMDVIKR